MQTLYLLRHSKAEPWTPEAVDFDRPLARRGRDQADRLARWAARELAPPDHVLCSPSRRTVETLAPWLDAMPGLEARTDHRREIYEASVGDLHALAQSAFDSVDRVLMVGHNPGFEWLMRALLPRSTEAGRMTTGALAVIDMEPDFAAAPDGAVLRQFVTKHDV